MKRRQKKSEDKEHEEKREEKERREREEEEKRGKRREGGRPERTVDYVGKREKVFLTTKSMDNHIENEKCSK